MRPLENVMLLTLGKCLSPHQFVHLSELFRESFFVRRGVHLVGTIGCGTLDNEIMHGSISQSLSIINDALTYLHKHHTETNHLCPYSADFEEFKERALPNVLNEVLNRYNVLNEYLNPNPNRGRTHIVTPMISRGSGLCLSHIPSLDKSNHFYPRCSGTFTDQRGFATMFEIADDPIVSIVATKGVDTIIASFHFGIASISDSVGRLLETFLHRYHSDGYELAAHISAGAHNLPLTDKNLESINWLMTGPDQDQRFLKSLSFDENVPNQTRCTPGAYAKQICLDFIKEDRIDANPVDTITDRGCYSASAAASGTKMNGRNAHLFALII